MNINKFINLNPAKIVLFSKNIFDISGGAERSMIAFLRNLSSNIEVIGFANNNTNDKLEIKKQFKIRALKYFFSINISLFPYFQYALHRSKLKQIAKTIDSKSTLVAQSLWAPVILNHFNGNKIYFARDETFYLKRGNYHEGIKYFLKIIYDFIELPFYMIFKHDQLMAIKNCNLIVANSNFMKTQILDIDNSLNVDVTYPDIDISNLKIKYEIAKTKKNSHDWFLGEGISMVGNTPDKGKSIFLKVANKFPDEKFYIFSKGLKKQIVKKNVSYIPWQENPATIYAVSKIILVPSKYDEAYGRVAAEAAALGLPCFVSGKGGLPEAVGTQESIFSNFKELVEKIRIKLNEVNS